jgi:hypothetical protein
MSELDRGTVIPVTWYTTGIPVTPTKTGEIELFVVREVTEGEFEMDICIYQDNGRWMETCRCVEAKNVVAWANITTKQLIFQLGLGELCKR